MKERSRLGIGTTTKRKARSITFDEEDKFWEAKVFHINTPIGLSNATFYYIGLRFALRGGQEIYSLTTNNFSLEERDGIQRLVYRESTSKNNGGGLKDKKFQAKTVEVLRDDELGDRCVVRLYTLYIEKRSNVGQDFLWVKPIPKPQTKWFSSQRLGVHTCQRKLKNFASEVSLEGRLTNHSMRRTSASRMARGGLNHRAIQSVTGHHSSAFLEYVEQDDTDIVSISRSIAGKRKDPRNICASLSSSTAASQQKKQPTTFIINISNSKVDIKQ